MRAEDQAYDCLSKKVAEKAKQNGLRVKLKRNELILTVEVWKVFDIDGMDDYEQMTSYKESFNSGGNDGMRMEYKNVKSYGRIELTISQMKSYYYPVGDVIENEEILLRQI